MSYKWDNKKPTAQMLGRWQPFHDGHYKLFKEIIKKTGQVCIQIRDVQGVDDNPFDFETVKKNIEDRLNPEFEGQFKIMLVPNITNICYGRGVGYKIEEIVLDEETQKISATKIRAKMREEGRIRQAKRMAQAALKLKSEGDYVIADFIAPTPEARSLFPADFIVWVDTIKKGRFEDTNKMFVNPKNFDFHVTTQDAKNWAPKIVEEIKK